MAFACVAAHGHINPTLPMVRELVTRGHRITYATHEKFRAQVEAAGAQLLPVPGEPPAPPASFDPDEIMRGMESTMDSARTGFALLVERFRADPPAALCYDAMTLAARMAAEKLALPDIALIPTQASNEHFSLHERMSGAASSTLPAGFAAVFERVGALTADLAAELGVRRIDPMDSTPRPCNIVFIPRSFQLNGDTFDDRFHFVGPSPQLDVPDWRPPRGSGPLLLASLGTVVNNRPAFFRSCLEAFGGSEWRVVLAIGDTVDPGDLGPVPDNAELHRFVPQAAVLDRADVFLTHAGMNSVLESLRAGVPMVTAPQQPEQDINAERVTELGLGTRLDDAHAPEDIRATVRAVHRDQQIHAAVRAMRAELHDRDGARLAADAVEAHLA
nr:macrolide family glycosyltransferase [Saccharopolyspora sp. HNM0983]